MDVLRSLITVGCLVRAGNEHGVVRDFDARLNIVSVQFSATGFAESVGAVNEEELRRLGVIRDYHFTKLRAGNDETEQYVTGDVTKEFPKQGWAIDEQRVLATPDYRTGRIG